MQGLDHSKSLSRKEVWKEVHRDSVLKMDETAVFFPEDHKFHVSAVMSAAYTCSKRIGFLFYMHASLVCRLSDLYQNIL